MFINQIIDKGRPGWLQLLSDYFKSGKSQTSGLPSVAYCADELHLSPNYFGDLIKKETGHTALEFIQSRLIDEAKVKMFEGSQSLSEIAYQLGLNISSILRGFLSKKRALRLMNTET